MLNEPRTQACGKMHSLLFLRINVVASCYAAAIETSVKKLCTQKRSYFKSALRQRSLTICFFHFYSITRELVHFLHNSSLLNIWIIILLGLPVVLSTLKDLRLKGFSSSWFRYSATKTSCKTTYSKAIEEKGTIRNKPRRDPFLRTLLPDNVSLKASRNNGRYFPYPVPVSFLQGHGLVHFLQCPRTISESSGRTARWGSEDYCFVFEEQ